MARVSNPFSTALREPSRLPGTSALPVFSPDRHEPHPLQSNFVVALLIAALVVMFAFTQYLTALHRQTTRDLANEWFARGEAAMSASQASSATDAYRNALSYDPDNEDYRLRLAQALLADGHYQEARSHLMSLWETNPASGEINFSLARLQARTGDKREAIRYYRSAINGVWDNSPHEQRIAARFELARYLMQQQDNKQAAVELIALQADPPQDESGELELAQMLADVGETARAESVYEGAIKIHPNSAVAHLGAGNASFAMGDYKVAERQLATAVRLDPDLSGAAGQLDLVREVLDMSPNLFGLSEAERQRRAATVFDAALSQLTACAAANGFALETTVNTPNRASTPATASVSPQAAPIATSAPGNLEQLYEEAVRAKPDSTVVALRRHPDSLQSTLDLAYEMTKEVHDVCPANTLADRALLTLAQHQGQGVQ